MSSVEETEDTRVNFIDIEDQKEISFDLLPNGRYRMEMSDLENQEVQNGDNAGARKLKVELTVDPEAEKFANRKVWDSITCTKKSLWKAKALFTACGFAYLSSLSYDLNTQEFTYTDDDDDTVVLDVTEFVGTVMDIQVGKRPKNKDNDGNEYQAQNQVKAYYFVEPDDEDLMP